MYSIISNHRQIDRQQWSKFVGIHPLGNIFQTPEIVDLYEISNKYEPLVVACLNDESDMVGILVGIIHREYTGVLGRLTSRVIVWGGPLVLHNGLEIVSLVLIEFDRICRKKAIYSQCRNLWDASFMKATLAQHGYSYEDHLDIHFDLNLGSEALWSGIHPTRRKQIKRGEKRGVSIRLSADIQSVDLEKSYSILKTVYKAAKLPYPEIDLFRNAFEIFGDKGNLKAVLAFYNDILIGFRFILCYQGKIYDWYAGSDPQYYDKYPNDILPWEIMKWGVENGMKIFDFGGAGKPGIPYGVRDYKLKFGGTLVNFGRFEKIHKPFIMSGARIAFQFWKLVKR